MTTKEVKSYLMQYRESLASTQELTEHLSELRAECEKLRDYTGEHIALDAAVAKYVDACNDAAAYLGMLAKRRKDIERTIDSVQSERLRSLLREVYVNGKNLVRIAADRDRSYEHICRLHGAALCAVADIMNK